MKLMRTIAVAVALAALYVALTVGISTVQSRMNAVRVEEKLTDTQPFENAPPIVAFTTVALGGFRGLLADWLWLRAVRKQDKGSYFEMCQLASWIVKLQPRFTGATAFLAWNMAYNISVTFTSFEDRWRWVQRGIELIRDEALVYNPGDPELFRELGWIFQHKMGKDLDDANRYYKTQFAREMIKACGTWPVDWAGLAASPETFAEFFEMNGVDETQLLTLTGAMDRIELEQTFRQAGELDADIVEALDAQSPGLAKATVQFLRNRWLRQQYKLEPPLIYELNQRYGPLDWRLPEAHAIFWATKGLAVAEDEMSISCQRMVFQSLFFAFRGGRLIHLDDIEHLEWTPNIELVDAVDRSYRDAAAKYEDDKRQVTSAHVNFLVDAIVLLYTFGQEKKAKTYFDRARKEHGAGRFYGTVEEFVLKELAGDMAMASYDQAQAAIRGYLMQTCYALALGDYDRAVTFERISRRLYSKYMKFIDNTAKRRGLPPYPQMKRNMVKEVLASFPPGLKRRLQQELRLSDGDLEFSARRDEEAKGDGG